MPRCLIIQAIHPAGIALLEQANIDVHMLTGDSAGDIMASVVSHISQADAVITRSAGLSAEAMQRAPKLKVIGSHGVGVNSIAMACANALAIPVVNTPHSNSNAVAELSVSLMLALMKQLQHADKATRANDFAFKYRASLYELTGKTLGMVGFGNIAKRSLAILRAGFQMEAWVHAPSASAAEVESYGARRASLAELLEKADVLSLHVPLTPQTHHLIGKVELERMKPSAVLINTSRGDVIDEAALIAALSQGRLAGAGLDVYHSENMPPSHPLLQLSNVVLTPHIGGSSQEALERTALAVCQQVLEVLHQQRPAHLVNPEIWPQRRR